jgi:hypothetical protein
MVGWAGGWVDGCVGGSLGCGTEQTCESIQTVIDVMCVMLWTPFCHRLEIYCYSNFFIKRCCKGRTCLEEFPRRHSARQWQLIFQAVGSLPLSVGGIMNIIFCRY